MTIQELLDWCADNDVSLDTHIVLRDKDDKLLIESNVDTDDAPYFGNCEHGTEYLDSVTSIDDETGERVGAPQFLILGTGY